MANQIFMRVNEVAEELGVSIPYAYKLIRQLNEELAKTGCITNAWELVEHAKRRAKKDALVITLIKPDD